MEFKQLQIFFIAANMLNFTKTAMQLGYTQSNITSQIKQLEEELHVKLFERFSRGLQLTSEGRILMQNAERILELCERTKMELSPDSSKGTLVIGAAETACIYRLPRLLLEYRERYPLVKIQVQEENFHPLLGLIRSNKIDVAVALTNEMDEPDMKVRTLCDERMAVVTSPLHPLAQKEVIVPQDLSGECLITSPAGCGYRPLILSTLNECEVKPGSIMELSSAGARKECTVCGLGFTILPRVTVKDELQRGRLIELSWSGPSFGVRTQLIYHREKWLSPALKAFLELCESVDMD